MSLVEKMATYNKQNKDYLIKRAKELGLYKEPKPKLRFETIKDSQGEWLRDNETGIEYSRKIGIHLIDH